MLMKLLKSDVIEIHRCASYSLGQSAADKATWFNRQSFWEGTCVLLH